MPAHLNRFFHAVGIDPGDDRAIRAFSERTGVEVARLRYYNASTKVPLGDDLERITSGAGISRLDLRLRLRHLDRQSLDLLAAGTYGEEPSPKARGVDRATTLPAPDYQTALGQLFQGDCLEILAAVPNESVDLVVADPPFNLKKLYPSGIDDDLREQQYLDWCEQWIQELCRVLRWNGSLFLWNLPRWNSVLAGVLEQHLTFRHWIAADIKYSLPISGRLYPSHYSLLYYCKGEKPRIFHPDRLPMQICSHCMADLRDYGGYKNKMNPKGVNLTDVWYDIHPVRHSKYKKRNGANEFPLQLLDRIIEMSSDEGDLVLDPFGGSGTTYAAAELKGRRWLGIEIGAVDGIVERLQSLDGERRYLENFRQDYNTLFTEYALQERKRLGLWTHESFSPSGNGKPGSASDNEELPNVAAEQRELLLRERRRAGFENSG